MSKRKPTIVPSLQPTSTIADNTQRARKIGIVPHQSTLSVQNVPDYSTPAGAAMANEEMRRLRLGIENLKQRVEAQSGEQQLGLKSPSQQVTTNTGTGKDEPISIETTEWALTLKSNGIEVDDPLVVQCINFIDTQVKVLEARQEFKLPIKFHLAKSFLEDKLKTEDEAVQIDIIANAITYFYDWLMFRDSGQKSIQISSSDKIRGGVFDGLDRRVITLQNDEWYLSEFMYYGTGWIGEDGENRGWKKLPISWKQPAVKFITQPSETDASPIGSIFIVSTETTFDEWLELGFINYLVYKFGEPFSSIRALQFVEPMHGDVISVLFPTDESSVANCRPKLYQYANKEGILKWWDITQLYGNIGDAHFVYEQVVPANEWLVTHNLGKRPSVTVCDTSDSVIYGEVVHIDNNTLKVKFKYNISGRVYLN